VKCPICDSVMVEKPPTIFYTTNPAQYDKVMWCGCGYQENCGRVYCETVEDTLRRKWERANGSDGLYAPL